MSTTKKWIYSGLFLALAMVLPFLTGQIPSIGSMLLPMHLPAFLCGLICGFPYGALVGFISPLLRYVLFGMPPIFPTGIAMAFELLTYGLVSGLVYSHSKQHNLKTVYLSLIIAMLAGRIVWGLATMLLLGYSGKSFTLTMFMTSGFVTGLPGIVLQLILIPAIMLVLNKTGLIKFNTEK